MTQAYSHEYKSIVNVIEWKDGHTARIQFAKDGFEWDVEVEATDLILEEADTQ